MKRALVLVLPLLLVVVGCPRQRKALGPVELKTFTSDIELKQYIADVYNQTYYSGWEWLFGCAAGLSPNFADTTGGSGATRDFSTTNLQETGVDESDVIKTDGTNLYVVARQKFDIVQAFPPTGMKVLGHLDLDLPGKELYLQTNQAIVLAQSSYDYYSYYYPAAGEDPQGAEQPWLDNMPTFDVSVVDTSTPEAPGLVKKYSFQGTLVTSRMVGSKLYLVSYLYPDIAGVTARNGVAKTSVEDILPKYRTVVAGQETILPLVDWSDVYHPENPDGYSLINVTTIETANLDTAPASTAILANYGVIYASTQALYITSTNYDWYGYQRDTTEVHKFDLTGDVATYVASGSVPGWLLNQFSMGEKDGFLRVASTEAHTIFDSGLGVVGAVGTILISGFPATENHVVVLEQVGDRLQVAGQLDGLSKGEELYAARFFGDRGFLVTFKMIDPLLTVDLSDPRNPKLAGELKVPGFSEYIHMMDENHLLTIGKGGQDEGDFAWFLGVKLSIFDVTDLANPTLVQSTTLGTRGSDSEALYNHKAFTYHNGMLAIPIDLYEGQDNPPYYGDYSFGGLMVLRVSLDKGFEEVGRIATINQANPYSWGSQEWTRGVFIGDSVYAACEHDIKSAAVADMSTLQSAVDLP